jgi:hypothetical protein
MRLADLALINCARFRCVRGGAIVSVVRASCGMRARFVVAMLSLALLYASTCSATCAICLSAAEAAATTGQECGHATSADARGGLHQQCPAKPDCSARHHSSFDVLQGDGFSPIQLSASGAEHLCQLSVEVVGVEGVVVAASFLSDLAPPRYAMNIPQQKISILRI